jgi:serine/threonine protein kinase
MLIWDPKKRLTAKDALSHPYFTSEPLPCKPSEIPNIEGELKELNFRDVR